MTFLRKSYLLIVVWIKSLATAAWSFCSGSRSHRLNFATTHFMPRSCIKISDSVVFGIPRSASCSRAVSCQSLLIASRTHSTFSGVLLLADLPEHGSLWKDSSPSWKHLCHTFGLQAGAQCTEPHQPGLVPHFYLHCTHCIVPEILLNHPSSFYGGMFKLNTNFDADSFLYLLSHFECDRHTVHMLTQWHLPPPLTSTVKSSLFMHAHSSPLSLTARSHRCHRNCSCYSNSVWTFSR